MNQVICPRCKRALVLMCKDPKGSHRLNVKAVTIDGNRAKGRCRCGEVVEIPFLVVRVGA